MWPKNLSLKLTALGLAFLLWFHVATNREYDYPITMNLAAGEMPQGFSLAEPLPGQIKLLLHGTGKELVRLLWNEGRAGLLLEPWMQGSYPVTTDHILVDVNAEVRVKQIIEPLAFNVHVDTVVQRRVEIELQGEYATAAGKSLVRAPQLEPHFVMLLGPRTQLEKITTLGTLPVDTDPLEETTRLQATLDLKDIYGVNAAPSAVHVLFEVEDSKQRQVDAITVQVPSGWIADPPTVTLNVAAAQARLDELTASAFRVSVSPGQIFDSGEFVSVEATVPPYVQILSVTPEQVKLFRP